MIERRGARWLDALHPFLPRKQRSSPDCLSPTTRAPAPSTWRRATGMTTTWRAASTGSACSRPWMTPADSPTSAGVPELVGIHVFEANDPIIEMLDRKTMRCSGARATRTNTRTAGDPRRRSSSVRSSSSSSRSTKFAPRALEAVDEVGWLPQWGAQSHSRDVEVASGLVHQPPAHVGRAAAGLLRRASPRHCRCRRGAQSRRCGRASSARTSGSTSPTRNGPVMLGLPQTVTKAATRSMSGSTPAQVTWRCLTGIRSWAARRATSISRRPTSIAAGSSRRSCCSVVCAERAALQEGDHSRICHRQFDRREDYQSPRDKPASAEFFYNKYGADLVRLWVASVDYREDVPFSVELFEQNTEVYRRIRNTLRILLGNLHGFDRGGRRVERRTDPDRPVDSRAPAREW